MIALVLGGLVRWQVIAGREFPLNDGGFWYVFANALLANNFALPATVEFNGGLLPTYYPPVAAYLIAALSKLLSVEVLSLLLWLPFILSNLMIPVFYFFVSKLYADVYHPRFAVIIFALFPVSFRWFLMGGGVSRSLGIIFMMLCLSFILDKDLKVRKIILAGVMAGLAGLCHPVAGLLTVISILILLFLSRTTVKTAAIALTIAGITALPWLFLVMSRVGISPFLNAFAAGEQSLFESPKILISINITPPLAVLSAFSVIGFIVGIARFRQFSILLLLAMSIFCPLFIACGIGCLPLTLICAEGAVLVAALFASSTSTKQLNASHLQPIILSLFIFLSFIKSLEATKVISKQSMTNEEFREIRSLKLPEGNSSEVLVLTKHNEIGDAVGEWIGSFTKYKSVITHQMGEWSGEKERALEIQRDLELITKYNYSYKIKNLLLFYPNLSFIITLNRFEESLLYTSSINHFNVTKTNDVPEQYQ